jgi:hypothetical protein
MTTKAAALDELRESSIRFYRALQDAGDVVIGSVFVFQVDISLGGPPENMAKIKELHSYVEAAMHASKAFLDDAIAKKKVLGHETD